RWPLPGPMGVLAGPAGQARPARRLGHVTARLSLCSPPCGGGGGPPRGGATWRRGGPPAPPGPSAGGAAPPAPPHPATRTPHLQGRSAPFPLLAPEVKPDLGTGVIVNVSAFDASGTAYGSVSGISQPPIHRCNRAEPRPHSPTTGRNNAHHENTPPKRCTRRARARRDRRGGGGLPRG